jgi:uncharacterized protein (DUF1501 family)
MKKNTRREFLKLMKKNAQIALAGTLVPQIFSLPAYAAGKRKFAQIFLSGGCDAMLTHLKEGDSQFMNQYRIARPTLSLPIKDSSGNEIKRLPLSGSLYSLHPRLTEFQRLYNNGELAIISGCGILATPTGSHEDASAQILYGMVNGRAFRPSAGWMKRIALDNFTSGTQLVDCTGGSTATSGFGAFEPLAAYDMSNYGFDTISNAENGLRIGTVFALVVQQNENNPKINDFVKSYKSLESTVNTVKEMVASTQLATPFPNTPTGIQLRDLFISFVNLPTQIGFISQGGYDVHGDADPNGLPINQPKGQSAILKELNDAVLAFRINCQTAGIWNDVAININTEFGRTNLENGSKGLDHAGAHIEFMFGGGVRGGHYGTEITIQDLQSSTNSITASVASADVYYEAMSYLGLNTRSLLPAGHIAKSLGLFR